MPLTFEPAEMNNHAARRLLIMGRLKPGVTAGQADAEAGEVFSGKIAIDPSRTTLFKSVGLGVQDIATAHFLYERTRNGAGK